MLSKIIILSIICGVSFAQFINKKWPPQKLITPSDHEIEVSWAITPQEQTKGLSFLKPAKMKRNMGLLFPSNKSEMRKFWMPNTYFDLDIIFLDEKFKVVAIESNVKHFLGREPYYKVPKTKTYKSTHVLELHGHQAKNYSIKVGSTLKWKRPKAVKEFLKSSLGQYTTSHK